MTPEEWLRERGIDITRRPGARPGELASQHTHALPSVPGDDDDEDVASQATRLVPTIVRLDLRLGGDVAEWPTAALPDPPAAPTDDADAFVNDSSDDATTLDDGFDYTIEDEMTVPLPIITPDHLTPPPDPASTGPAESVSPPTDAAEIEDAAASSDISTTPTRRLSGAGG